MFGVGPQELLIIGLLVLVIFGPGKLPSMARDFGRLVTGASRTVEEFKSELLSEDIAEEVKSELVSSAGKEEKGEPASSPHRDDET